MPALLSHKPFDLQVAMQPIEGLRLPARRTRKHSKKQVQQLAASIRAFGFVNPVLLGADGEVIAGAARVEAARSLDMTHLPTIRLDHMSEADRRAYRIADNRLAELAGWDRELLSLELQELEVLDLDFELETVGFEGAELDQLLGGDIVASEDDVPAAAATPVTRLGDVWELGAHRLACGDARDVAVYKALLGDERARMMFTDPPYNVPIAGFVGGGGVNVPREFVMASGEMSPEAFRLSHRQPGRRRPPPRGRRHQLRLHGLAPHGGDARRRPRLLRRVQ